VASLTPLISFVLGQQQAYESSYRKKNHPLDAYYTKHTHTRVYLRAGIFHSRSGQYCAVCIPARGGAQRFLVVEGALAAETAKKEKQ
jgi:hypothetical protein